MAIFLLVQPVDLQDLLWQVKRPITFVSYDFMQPALPSTLLNTRGIDSVSRRVTTSLCRFGYKEKLGNGLLFFPEPIVFKGSFRVLIEGDHDMKVEVDGMSDPMRFEGDGL